MFRNLLAFALCAVVATPAVAQSSHAVRGYTRQDGTYVAPHMQTNPNSTRADNWSTKGNVNPYTGQEGTKDANSQPSSSSNPYDTSKRTRY